MTHLTRALPLAAFAGMSLLSLACLPGGPGNPGPTATPQVDVQAARTAIASTITPSPTALPVLPPLTRYLVKSGDYPTLIAEDTGVPPDQRDAWVEELLALNGVETTSLQIGQELILPPIGIGTSSRAAVTTTPGNPPAAIVEPLGGEPDGTPTPSPTAHVGPPPFAASPPLVGFITPTATFTPVVPSTPTPLPTAAPGTRAWLTSSDEAALYYYCDLDSGWTNIPGEKLLAFDSEQQLLAIWGRFRTKAPDSIC